MISAVQDEPGGRLALLDLLQGGVHVVELPGLQDHLDAALGAEFEGLSQVEPATDDRAWPKPSRPKLAAIAATAARVVVALAMATARRCSMAAVFLDRR